MLRRVDLRRKKSGQEAVRGAASACQSVSAQEDIARTNQRSSGVWRSGVTATLTRFSPLIGRGLANSGGDGGRGMALRHGDGGRWL
ncbi:hypothetical protein E2C01_069946 [Portunus trituberculatus]|uniref:Uncharacterized protein n=1 Tax=Portunus trituberculatus TaxID=210409 RepID=A0A5B7I0S5_PORTR|nr:hypothetical protein [Portunus trituberculatus]